MAGHQQTVGRDLTLFLGDLAGQDLTGVDTSLNFFELGFDSLFLTQASAALKNRFGVKVTFRQLLEDLTSIDSLAAYLASHQAPSPTPPAPSPSPDPFQANPPVEAASAESVVIQSPAESTTRVAGGSGDRRLTGTVLERVFNAQLKVMEQQLAMLRQSTPTKADFAITVPSDVGATAPEPEHPRGTKPVQDGETKPSHEATAASPMPQHGPFKPLDKGSKGGLTDQQEAHLSWLVPRYVAKTQRSKDYTQEHRGCLADPRAVAGFKLNWKEMVYPIVATRSAGAYLWDLDGNRWLDVTMGFGVNLLGHSPSFVTEAVKGQLDLGVEIGPQSPIVGEVARLICKLTGMERVTFCNTGSEAVMAAIRLCRTVTGRTRIVLFAGAYHGTFDEVLVKGALKNGEPRTLAIAPGVAPNLIQEVTVLEYGSERSLAWIRQNAGDLAAVLVEPVQSRHPGLQPAEFLKELRRITEAAETPLIFDEVITGFRCHPGGAQAHFGIRADLATYGKIVGGGMPLGFIAGRKEYLDALDGGHWQFGDASFPPTGVTFFAGTFVRHPLAMAAAKAILHHLDQHGAALQQGLGERTTRMTGELNAYFARHGVPVELENFTSVWYPRFGAEVKYGSLLYFHLREKGVHIWEGRPCFLSTAHTAEDVETLIRAFKQSVAEMQAGGFLPGTSDPDFAKRSGEGAAWTNNSLEAAALGDGRYPVTEAQSELWIASQLGPEASSAFNESCSLEFKGPLHEEALHGAIREVVRRHEALRSVFLPQGDFQRFLPELQVEVVRHDLRGLPAATRDARLRELKEAEGARAMDLTRGPLVILQYVILEAERHVLLFTAHHIACDGWSYDIILRELGHCYSALVRNEPITLPPATPFREYALWEKQQRSTQEGIASTRYWKGQYATLPPMLELPSDKPRPARRSYRGSRTSRTLGADLVKAVRKAGARQGVTLFGTLLAGYGALIQRLTGTSDLVIGILAAGQNLIGKDDLVGHCANLLPLRLKLDGDPPVKSWLRAAKQAVLDATDHQHFTFGALLQQLNLPRRPGHVPLAPIVFNLDPPLSEIRFEGLEHDIELNPRRCYQFDLGFNVVESGAELVVECDYNTDLFEASTIERWLEHYEALLAGMAGDPEQPMSRLDPNSEAQRRQLLVEWNNTRRDRPSGRLFPTWFAEQARRTPEAVAVVFGEGSLSYGELERRSNQLARRLQASGVGPNRLVGVCVERSVEMLVCVVAVLKAGGAYVPLDPDLPAERLGFMIADADAAVLLTQESLIARLPTLRAEIIGVDRDRPAIEAFSDGTIECAARAEDAAYVIYTSGSTGKPKGVEVLHGGVANLLASMIEAPGIGPGDRILALTTLSFDIAVMELLLPLVVGARVILVPRAVLLDPPRLAAVLRDQGVTIMQATPATWRMLVDSGWAGEKQIKALTGGEALVADLAKRLLVRVGQLWNLYAPTETTVYSTFTRIESAEDITIGRPIANTTLYVVDDQQRPVPIGGIGELWIGGAGVARGYRNRPELTQERFMEDPFRPGTGERVYRTGDLARYRADGRVDFLGRSDFQVKLRGHRIELGEIESALVRQPLVRQAVVMARDGQNGEKTLAAYVVPATAPSMEFWMASPVVNGKQIYDDTLYEFMSRDQARNEGFSGAFRKLAVGKVVLDVGTGKDAILARLAIEAGARKVYAIEILEEPYRQAKELVRRLGLQDRIEVLLGDATSQELPESVDVCVAEVIGHIGGEAGLETILGNAARRHLRPGGVVLPHAVQTCVAAVSLPENFLQNPCFGRLAATYVDRVFEAAGAPFDLRLSITGASAVHLASSVGVFEECDLREGTSINYERPIRLTITREARVDGLLLWLKLSLSPEHQLDGLLHQASWLPVYLPVFQPPLEAQPGDVIEGVVRGRLSENGLNKDYAFQGEWVQATGGRKRVGYEAPHQARQFRGSPFYERLFRNGRAAVTEDAPNKVTATALRSALKSTLPDYMIPASVTFLDRMPLTPSGKVDRKALPAPEVQIDTEQLVKVAPRNETEVRLARLWKDLLNVNPVGVHDGFFDLGGHSLLAVRLVTAIEQEFGKRLALAEILEADTIAKLAEVIQGTVQPRLFRSLVPIQSRGDAAPFFCVHGGGGEVVFGRDLARHLGQEIPFYGLHAHGVDDLSQADTSVEAMAQRYLTEIRVAQPVGPYFLGGYCMGGLVAYEMAQRLLQLGEKVGLVVLIDSHNPAAIRVPDTFLAKARIGCEKIVFQLRNLARLSPEQRRAYMSRRFGATVQRRSTRAKARWEAFLGQFRKNGNGSAEHRLIEDINDAAGDRYRPAPYPGDVVIFRPEITYSVLGEESMGWKNYVRGDLAIVNLPVAPGGMLVDPFIGSVAAKLRESLQLAHAKAASSADRGTLRWVHEPAGLGSGR